MPAGHAISPAVLVFEQRASTFVEQQLARTTFELEQRASVEFEQRTCLQQFERWQIEQQRAHSQQLEQLAVIEFQQSVELQQ